MLTGWVRTSWPFSLAFISSPNVFHVLFIEVFIFFIKFMAVINEAVFQ